VNDAAGPAITSPASSKFAASKASASSECTFYGSAFAACSSPQFYAGLADGAHGFQVRAIHSRRATAVGP